MSTVYLGANVDVLTDVLHVYLGMMVDRQFNPQMKPLNIYVTFGKNVFLVSSDKTAYKCIQTHRSSLQASKGLSDNSC